MSYKKNELQWMRLGESEAIKCICRAKCMVGRINHNREEIAT